MSDDSCHYFHWPWQPLKSVYGRSYCKVRSRAQHMTISCFIHHSGGEAFDFGALPRIYPFENEFSSALRQSLFPSSFIIQAIGNAGKKIHQNKRLPHFCIIVTIFCNYNISFRLHNICKVATTKMQRATKDLSFP